MNIALPGGLGTPTKLRRLEAFLCGLDDLLSMGLASLLREQLGVDAQEADPTDLASLASRVDDGLLLMDTRGVEDWLEVVRAVPPGSGLKIVALGPAIDEATMMLALRRGVMGYTDVRAGTGRLVATIQAVLLGCRCWDARVTQLGEDRFSGPGELAALTPQETRVLHLVAEGMTNPEIGQELGVSPKTIRNYASVIFSKLGVNRRTEAAGIYHRRRTNGDVPPVEPREPAARRGSALRPVDG